MGRIIPFMVFLSFFAGCLWFVSYAESDKAGGSGGQSREGSIGGVGVNNLTRFLKEKNTSSKLSKRAIGMLRAKNVAYVRELDKCVLSPTQSGDDENCGLLINQFLTVINSRVLVNVMEIVLNNCEDKKRIIDACGGKIVETQSQIAHLQEVQDFLTKFKNVKNPAYSQEKCNKLIEELDEKIENMESFKKLLKSVEDSEKQGRDNGIWEKLLGGIKDFIEKHFAGEKEFSRAMEEKPFPGVKSDYVHKSQYPVRSPSQGVPGRVILRGGSALIGGGRQYSAKDIEELWKDPGIRMGCSMDRKGGHGCTKADFYDYIRSFNPGSNK